MDEQYLLLKQSAYILARSLIRELNKIPDWQFTDVICEAIQQGDAAILDELKEEIETNKN